MRPSEKEGGAAASKKESGWPCRRGAGAGVGKEAPEMGAGSNKKKVRSKKRLLKLRR